jgi:hypothetical protein
MRAGVTRGGEKTLRACWAAGGPPCRSPDAVSSIFPRFIWKVVFSQSRMARRPTKKAASIMPARAGRTGVGTEA